MCLIVFRFQDHPNYKLILAANRDEFYNRQAAPAEFWKNYPHVLGGCDLEVVREDGTCGTWFGISKKGRIAMITNYRNLKNLKSNAPSRGFLVSDFLTGDEDPYSYLRKVDGKKNDYNGFNLIVGNVNQLYYLSNYKDRIEKIEPGYYGLSNHLLETSWPKVVLSKSTLEPFVNKPEVDLNQLLNAMSNEMIAPDENLPDTGIGLERERVLSSMFIKTKGYGTRCTTAMLIDNSGKVTFIERTYRIEDFSFTDLEYKFNLPV